MPALLCFGHPKALLGLPSSRTIPNHVGRARRCASALPTGRCSLRATHICVSMQTPSLRQEAIFSGRGAPCLELASHMERFPVGAGPVSGIRQSAGSQVLLVGTVLRSKRSCERKPRILPCQGHIRIGRRCAGRLDA